MPQGALAEVLDGVDVDETAAADDRHAVGGVLHLVERVRGEEDRAPVGRGLAQERAYLGLEKRVEPGARLVEDDQLRAVHERLNEADLLAVALREVADGPVELEAEPLAELGSEAIVGAAAKPRERVELLAAVIRSFSRRSPGRYPMRRRASTPWRRESSPSTAALPAVAWIRSSRSRIVVLLPAPFGPR